MTQDERTGKLKYLIGCLESEMPEYASYRASDDPGEAFDLYRALCNVRMPKGKIWHTLPEQFYKVQAEVLRDITAEKGVTDAEDIRSYGSDERLSLWQGDITSLKADAIVNAANSQMLGCFSPLHGCIDNMIHTMSGTELREKCCLIMRAQGTEEPAGRAKITPGYNLPAKYVIHTVGPIVQWGVTDELKDLLASCYRSCLDIAGEYGLNSIAFCCISTGVFRFPQKKAAETATVTVRKWLDDHPGSGIKKIVFNVFKDSDREIYKNILSDRA